MQKLTIASVLLILISAAPSIAQQDDEVKPIAFSVAEGAINLQAPGAWTKVQPRINFIEAEFSIPKKEGDPKNGRLTIMGAGGSIEANIDRWYGQFTQPDGSDTSDSAKVEKMTISDMQVHMVDITGTYLDTSGGPFNPNAAKVERDDYRMVAAIIETAENGNYFIKMYGPKPTIAQHIEGFKSMVKNLKLAD